MRMRRKGHLDERVLACADIMQLTDLTEKDMRKSVHDKQYYDFAALFGNTNPIYLEVGCGRGNFACEMAKRYPDINFLACERISNVIIEGAERAKEEGIKNIYFFNCNAQVLTRYIKDGTVSRLYLNFSDPLPKDGCVRQRLTNPRQLDIYYRLLIPGGEIFQKTDNDLLYAYSLEQYPACGFEITSISEDWNSVEEGDIETEYEKHFKDLGKNIYRITARKTERPAGAYTAAYDEDNGQDVNDSQEDKDEPSEG